METRERWTIEGLAGAVAETGRYAGGGAVAAMSLVGAAATAELVIALSRGRKTLDDATRARLDEILDETTRLRATFLNAIDHDIDSLSELMAAQRSQRQVRDSEDIDARETAQKRMQAAVQSAIDVPLAVARDGLQLLRGIDEARTAARKFTLSDLGAAAATAHGAIVSLALMAEVNLSLLETHEQAARLQTEIDDVLAESGSISTSIIDGTRRVTRTEERDSGD